jgi:hypothetical protein
VFHKLTSLARHAHKCFRISSLGPTGIKFVNL